ncbi:hypothetical protein [Clavibacter capsici]|uniref:hypothetical protein n=1 Tax=Clavibacter capsici TaxID=1874630 RepID=UPI001427F491|nr:hypothetical protein [Clavibacter capsici]QIS39818.1 hypothetical protein GW572_12010 [Clavibacter capsici]
MSSIRRTRSTRSTLTTVAITAVAAIGIVIAAPGSGAFAVANPNSPEVRLSHSIESGHLLDDLKSGRITESDVLHAASTGIDVNGQHFDNWIDPSPEQTAAADAQVASLRASAEADPKMKASLESAKASLDSTEASLNASLKAGDPSALGTGGSISESKNIFKHLIHWFTLYINHDWLRGLIGTSAGIAGVSVCVFFDLSRVTCGIVGAFFAGGISEVVKGSASCSGKGLYIKIPDTWNSHCEE